MAHISPQTSLRAGKTYLWHHNVLIPTKQFPNSIIGNTSNISGLENMLQIFLNKKRLFLVKANLKYSSLNSKYYLYILFLPRLKPLPYDYIRTHAMRMLLYRS